VDVNWGWMVFSLAGLPLEWGGNLCGCQLQGQLGFLLAPGTQPELQLRSASSQVIASST